MAGSVSKTILVGNLGQDPELKSNGGGKTVAILSVATSESWKDKDSGVRKERTEWHRVVVFAEPLVRFAEHHLKKGMKVWVEGQNRTRKWSKDGHDMWTTEVVLDGFHARLDSLERLEGGGNRPPPPDGADDYGTTRERDEGGSYSRPGADRAGQGAPASADDIPFACEVR